MNDAPHVLGVTRSAAGRAWRPRLDRGGEARALAIGQQHGHPDILARVMAGRGVSIDEAATFLDPTIRRAMPDPSTLNDMAAAVERLVAAVERGETVAVFGDYDVDGACSAALLARFLERCGCRALVYIPDRIFEGYGPNVDAVRALSGQGATLLVTVDCGTTSFEPLKEASTLGLDTIVIDHHQAPEQLPPARAIVNPNRQDDLSGLGTLCAAGVVYMTLVALHRALRARAFWADKPPPDLLADLDLVALATIADVVPLVGLNRAFVTKGLAVMRARGRPGLAALFDVAASHGPPRPEALGFVLGPRINAGGRIGDASLGARLLMLDDDIEARRIAAELHRLNAERQAIEHGTLEEAESLADAHGPILVAGDTWHPGVVGLVASRLREKFGRPAFAVAFNGDIGTGSGRSVPGVDLGRAVREAVTAGMLVKGGGHAMAAGLTVERAKLEALRGYLAEALRPALDRIGDDDAMLIDGALTARGASFELIDLLERAGPYGAGHPEPVFAFPAHRVTRVDAVGAGHLRVRALAGDGAALDAIAFRVAGQPLGDMLVAAAGGAPVHLAGTLGLDQWNGSQRVRVRLTDAAAVP